MDAFLLDLKGLKGYAFPPFCIIGRCPAKVRKEGATIVASVWPAKPWFATLLNKLVEEPILLPPHPSLFLSPIGEPHPLLEQGGLTLAAWKVSGDTIDSQVFLRQQPLFSQVLGVMAHARLMSDPGVNGLAGGDPFQDKVRPAKVNL